MNRNRLISAIIMGGMMPVPRSESTDSPMAEFTGKDRELVGTVVDIGVEMYRIILNTFDDPAGPRKQGKPPKGHPGLPTMAATGASNTASQPNCASSTPGVEMADLEIVAAFITAGMLPPIPTPQPAREEEGRDSDDDELSKAVASALWLYEGVLWVWLY